MNSISPLSIVLLLAVVHQGVCIKCYSCSTEMGRYCGDPFDISNKYLLTDCDKDRSNNRFLSSDAFCRKVKYTVRNDTMVVRSCAWSTNQEEDPPCASSAFGHYNKPEYCSVCQEDECNSANLHQISALLFAMPVLYFIYH